MYRKTYVKIDTSIIQDNISKIIQKYNSYKYYIGIVKANAYGHGDYIVNDIIKSGINYKDINKYNITITIDSLDYALSLSKKKLLDKLKAHIKLDTGMNRIGFKIKEEVNQTISILKDNKSIFLEGIYTHIGTSGINDNYYNKSIDTFKVDETVNIHDKVEIFGNNISIIDVSNRINSYPYRLLTSITTRVHRLYNDNKEIKY